MTEAERKTPEKKIVIQQLEIWIDLKDTFLQQINAERKHRWKKMYAYCINCCSPVEKYRKRPSNYHTKITTGVKARVSSK